MDARIVILGLAMVVIGVFANAAYLEGSCSSTNIQCQLSLNDLKLCNDSGKRETYTVSARGEAAGWISVIPDSVQLSAGECRQLHVYTIANCYAEPGVYEAEVVVSNDKTAYVPCRIEVEQGHFVDVGITPKSQAATQCEEKNYTVKLANNSTIPNQNTEQVKLEVRGLASEWFTLEKSEVVVEKGQQEYVNLAVRAPCDAELGTYNFDVFAYLVNPNFFSAASARYALKEGQEIEIGAGERYDACIEEGTTYRIPVSNRGKLRDSIELILSGPEWASISESALDLDAGEEKEVELNLAKADAEPGKYEISIIAKSKMFDYEAARTFTAELKDCYNLLLEKVRGEEKACAEDEVKHVYRITNNRSRSISADVSIDGINSTVSETYITLAPGQSKEVEARFDVAELAKGAKVSRKDVAIEIVMDSSGSMVEKVNSHTKMDAAKNAIISFVNNITEVQLGLRVFGQGSACEGSRLLVPVSALNVAEITGEIEEFSPKGLTPLGEALSKAADDFGDGASRNIILVSDGKETCNADIGAAAEKLKGKGIAVYAIGFDIDEKGRDELKEIASATGGQYYDAGNADELLGVFKEITRELDIEPAATASKTYRVNLNSDKFSYSKEYSLEIEDCYNALVMPPALNLCKGVPSTNFIAINNLGTKNQKFRIEVSPEWVDAADEVRVAGMGSVLVPITISPKADAAESEITATITSGNFSATQSKPINYLSETSCFGIDMIIVNYAVDAATCEGVKQRLVVENRGVVGQKVEISADKPWVYFDESEVEIGSGERRDVYFIISPPFDTKSGDSAITITAKTDRGFTTSAEIRLMVEGGEQAAAGADLNVSSVTLKKLMESGEVDAEVEFEVTNNSSRTLRIMSVEATNFKAVFDVDSAEIAKGGTAKVTMYLDLPEGYAESKATVSVAFKTDEGTFVRDIEVELAKEGAGKEEGGQEGSGEKVQVAIGAGFFGLLSVQNVVIGVLLLVVAALVVYAVVKAVEKPKAEPVPMSGVAAWEEETKKKEKAARKRKTATARANTRAKKKKK